MAEPGVECTIEGGRCLGRAWWHALMAAALLLLPAVAAHALEPRTFEGEWRFEDDVLAVDLGVSRQGGGHRVRLGTDGVTAFDAVLVADPRPGIFTEAAGGSGGIMGMLGLGSNEEDRDVLDGKPILWARDTGTALILYRVQITDGRHAIDRFLLSEPTDEGVALEIWRQRHGEDALAALVTLERGP